MIKIAVCDDDPICREQILSFLKRYSESYKDENFSFSAFASGKQMLDYIEERGDFDIYLLDVIMPEMNGIETGVRLRNVDMQGKIIYLTSSPEYGVDSYLAKAFNYLLKPVTADKLTEVVSQATELVRKEKQKCIIVHTRDELVKIPFDSILYAELVKRSIVYHLTDGSSVETVTLRVPFAEAMISLLKDDRFLLCGASLAVNLFHVTSVEKDALVLKNIRIYMPKKACSNIRSAWLDFWMKNGG